MRFKICKNTVLLDKVLIKISLSEGRLNDIKVDLPESLVSNWKREKLVL